MASGAVLHIDTGKSFRGGQRQLLLLSHHLRQHDLRQYVACPSIKSNISSSTSNKEKGLNLRIKDIPMVGLSNQSLIRRFSTGSLKGAITEHGITIVHAHDSGAHTLGVLLKRWRPDLKLVVTRRVIFSPSGPLSRRFKYRKYVDQFIAISRAVADSLTSIGVRADVITIIPSALDIEGIQKASPDRSVRSEIPGECRCLVVSAGALTVEKDFATAIRAMKSASKKASGIGLIILGDGPERKVLEDIIVAEGIDNVRLLGYREPMAPIFKACDLFLATSQSEGLNTSAIEAAACGLPLIVSDIGGLPEIAEKDYNGLLCEPGNPEEFAKAIIDLWSNEAKRKRMAENSACKSTQFDIGQAARKTADLYNRLLAETA